MEMVFLILHVGHGKCMRFVTAAGVSTGSYSKGSKFTYQCRMRVTSGLYDKIKIL
jgi:hypothetical protein